MITSSNLDCYSFMNAINQAKEINKINGFGSPIVELKADKNKI